MIKRRSSLHKRELQESELRVQRDCLEILVERRTSELLAVNQSMTAMNEELTAMNEEMAAMNEELLQTNLLLQQEVELRTNKEQALRRREQQYRAATRLLVQPASKAPERLVQILQDALDLLGSPSGFIGRFDPVQQVMVRQHVLGPVDFGSMESQSMNDGMVGQVWKTGEAYYIEDYRDFSRRLSHRNLDRLTTILMVPLKLGDEVRGILAAHWLDELHPLVQEDIDVFQQYADLVSVALDRLDNYAEMKYLAYYDTLTGMANRASLNLWLEQELGKARQGKAGGGLFFIDLDELKIVNDTFGHSLGDDMILTAGNNIRRVVGAEAFCARIGGDEFIVVMSGIIDRGRLAEQADQLVKALSMDYVFAGEQIPMSASLGIVCYPDDGTTVDEIMKNADRAMYAAKACGRNCWRHYEPCLLTEEYENMILINGLRHAMERSEFCLHYQPVLRLSDRKIVALEALLRWNSKEHGAVSPARFIPLAEKSGLIVPIGRWVLNEACLFARELADLGRGGLHIAVNISPRQLAESDFIGCVQRVLLCAGIAASQLELEVTESILIESMEESIAKLKELCRSGINIALDDFGTGYSSLTYLRQLPVNTLKLDKSFIDCIAEDRTQAELVSYIIDMAHSLKLVVVAEGVEDPAQVELLSQYKCDYIQGYVFSRPEPAGTILTLLEREK
jgi:diguanylate cyclase (GGDEF)-like protein